MNILFLDSSNKEIFAAVLRDDKVYEKKQVTKNDIPEKMHIVLKELIDESNINKKDFHKFIVTVGPGSFTGIRMAVTVIKTYAWAVERKVVPISTLLFMATTNVKTKYIMPVILDRNGEAYVAIYDNELNCVISDQRTNLNDFFAKYSKEFDLTVVSNDELEGINSKKVLVDVKKIFSHYIDIEGENAHSIKPKYLKNTNAEESLKDDKRS